MLVNTNMGNWVKILTAISGIIASLLKGLDIAKDYAEKRGREKEIKVNEDKDDQLKEDIKKGNVDELNNNFGWDAKVTDTDEDTVKEQLENLTESKPDDEVEDLNANFGWDGDPK